MVEPMSDNSDTIFFNKAPTEPPSTESLTEPPTEPPTEPIEMPEDHELAIVSALDVKPILQKPELPTGCEVTSLCTVLNYYGFIIDKEELFDNFMPHTFNADCTFDDKYIGDPRANNGFGCYAPVVYETAKAFFESEKSDMEPYDLTGTPFRELFYQIEMGRPIVIWASVDLHDVTLELKWKTPDGREALFTKWEHCLVLTGYDLKKGVVYCADPLKGHAEYSLERFEMIYDKMGQQALVMLGQNEVNITDYVDISEQPEFNVEAM